MKQYPSQSVVFPCLCDTCRYENHGPYWQNWQAVNIWQAIQVSADLATIDPPSSVCVASLLPLVSDDLMIYRSLIRLAVFPLYSLMKHSLRHTRQIYWRECKKIKALKGLNCDKKYKLDYDGQTIVCELYPHGNHYH